MPPIHTAWAVSIGLKCILAFVAPFKLFRAWLIFCIAGSLISWWIGFAHQEWYESVWIAKSLLLCVWNAALVVDACKRIEVELSTCHYALCGMAALVCYSAFNRPPLWHGSPLEPIFADTALCSSFLAFTMVLAIGKYQTGLWWLHAAILFVYLLCDAMSLYPASEYISRIGIAVVIWTSLCYVAWITVHWKRAKIVRNEESRSGTTRSAAVHGVLYVRAVRR